MLIRKDSDRFIPRDIERRFRGATLNAQAVDRFRRRAGTPGIHFDSYGQSQIGTSRRENQDQFISMTLGTDLWGGDGFLGVADGIGGTPGGAQASYIAMNTLQRFVREEFTLLIRPERNDGEIIETLIRGLKRCHQELQHFADEHPGYSGMGTTMTAALVVWPRLYLVHIGDSRAYLLRNGKLKRLTHDHTYGQALLEAGVLNELTIKTSSMRNVLSNYLSGDRPEKDAEVHPDAHVELLRPGDTLLLSSDGLTRAISEDLILETLMGEASPRDLCRTLIERARERQSKSDATALVARFIDANAIITARRQLGRREKLE